MTTEKIEKLISIRDCKQAFVQPGRDNIIDLVHPFTGHSVYSNETLEEIGIRYPGAEVVNFDDWMKAKAAKQRLHLECHAIQFDCERQPHKWQNQVAQDLMHLLGRAMYFLETDRDESDVAAAQATLRIVRRVEEFEGIRRAK